MWLKSTIWINKNLVGIKILILIHLIKFLFPFPSILKNHDLGKQNVMDVIDQEYQHPRQGHYLKWPRTKSSICKPERASAPTYFVVSLLVNYRTGTWNTNRFCERTLLYLWALSGKQLPELRNPKLSRGNSKSSVSAHSKLPFLSKPTHKPAYPYQKYLHICFPGLQYDHV